MAATASPEMPVYRRAQPLRTQVLCGKNRQTASDRFLEAFVRRSRRWELPRDAWRALPGDCHKQRQLGPLRHQLNGLVVYVSNPAGAYKARRCCFMVDSAPGCIRGPAQSAARYSARLSDEFPASHRCTLVSEDAVCQKLTRFPTSHSLLRASEWGWCAHLGPRHAHEGWACNQHHGYLIPRMRAGD